MFAFSIATSAAITYNRPMIYILFALLGLLLGALINALADDLPERTRPQLPHCPQCHQRHNVIGWWASGRLLFQNGQCPNCELPTRKRPLFVEIGTLLLFTALPALISDPFTLATHSFYIAVLILIIVIDLEHRLILHVVTFPTTLLAIGLAYFSNNSSVSLAFLGAITGFILFYLLYWVGQILYGPGALGFGDVMLAMMMGAMLGFQLIIFTLVLGILIGGVFSIILVIVRRGMRGVYLPYGQYLAIAGIIMLIWGTQFFSWYTST